VSKHIFKGTPEEIILNTDQNFFQGALLSHQVNFKKILNQGDL